jgi:hypothetical protein
MQDDEFARWQGGHRVGTPIISAELHLEVIISKALDHCTDLTCHQTPIWPVAQQGHYIELVDCVFHTIIVQST